VDWITLAQNRVRCRVSVNMMKHAVAQKAGNFLSEQLQAYQEIASV